MASAQTRRRARVPEAGMQALPYQTRARPSPRVAFAPPRSARYGPGSMSRPELVIPVADLERGPKHAEFVLSEPWLRRALEGTEATVVAPGRVDVTVSKNGPDVLVRGQLVADLTLPCVVTLDPVPEPVRVEILLMLSPKSGATTAHEGHVARRRARPAKIEDPGASEKAKASGERPARGKGKGNAGAGDGHWDETPVLDDETAGQDTY